MQGENFISAVHLRKARSLANANDFVAFGGCKNFSPCTPLQNFLSFMIKYSEYYQEKLYNKLARRLTAFSICASSMAP